MTGTAQRAAAHACFGSDMPAAVADHLRFRRIGGNPPHCEWMWGWTFTAYSQNRQTTREERAWLRANRFAASGHTWTRRATDGGPS